MKLFLQSSSFLPFTPYLAVENEMLVHQMDIVTAFLNGDLEKLYMKQPEGFEVPDT